MCIAKAAGLGALAGGVGALPFLALPVGAGLLAFAGAGALGGALSYGVNCLDGAEKNPSWGGLAGSMALGGVFGAVGKGVGDVSSDTMVPEPTLSEPASTEGLDTSSSTGPAPEEPESGSLSSTAERSSAESGTVDRSAAIAQTKAQSNLRPTLDDSWFKDDGSLRWPDNDGAADAWSDKPLQPGDVIDRYGPDTGRFSSPMQEGSDGSLVGETYEARALPYDQAASEYHQYRVLSEIPNKQSTAAGWFDQSGGATQNLHAKISQLLQSGSLVEITK